MGFGELDDVLDMIAFPANNGTNSAVWHMKIDHFLQKQVKKRGNSTLNIVI